MLTPSICNCAVPGGKRNSVGVTNSGCRDRDITLGDLVGSKGGTRTLAIWRQRIGVREMETGRNKLESSDVALTWKQMFPEATGRARAVDTPTPLPDPQWPRASALDHHGPHCSVSRSCSLVATGGRLEKDSELHTTFTAPCFPGCSLVSEPHASSNWGGLPACFV